MQICQKHKTRPCARSTHICTHARTYAHTIPDLSASLACLSSICRFAILLFSKREQSSDYLFYVVIMSMLCNIYVPPLGRLIITNPLIVSCIDTKLAKIPFGRVRSYLRRSSLFSALIYIMLPSVQPTKVCINFSTPIFTIVWRRGDNGGTNDSWDFQWISRWITATVLLKSAKLLSLATSNVHLRFMTSHWHGAGDRRIPCFQLAWKMHDLLCKNHMNKSTLRNQSGELLVISEASKSDICLDSSLFFGRNTPCGDTIEEGLIKRNLWEMSQNLYFKWEQSSK
jgi:hypothetical protein